VAVVAKITQEAVRVLKRAYDQSYRISVYDGSAKVDLFVYDHGGYEAVNLKMSEAECEELITRLSFALHQAREARNG
jgi:hypothetical protein